MKFQEGIWTPRRSTLLQAAAVGKLPPGPCGALSSTLRHKDQQ